MSPYRLDDTTLAALLADDAPCGDATTHALGIGSQPGCMTFRARADMIVCGSEEAARLGELAGLAVADGVVPSGRRVAAGSPLIAFTGPAQALHGAWKTAQTLMEYLSGIASASRAIVDAARAVRPDIGVACTRKHFPGVKAAAIKAVLAGGASPHRLSLSETLLLFAEHRAFLGELEASAAIARLRQAWPERPVVVEVSAIDEALHWHAAGADILVTSAPYFAAPRDVAVSIAAMP